MADDRETENTKILEAVLFASGKSMTLGELSKAIGVASPGYVGKMLDKLIEKYSNENTPIGIFKLGDKYMMGVKEKYSYMIKEFAGKPDISKGGLRILAYISKNEPLMQSVVVKAFGSSSYIYLKELADKEFIETKKEGRSKRLTITKKFVEYFDVK